VAAGPELIRLAVFGQPVAQSLSPRIHGLFAEQFGLPVEYTAIEATHDSFPGLVRDLADRGGRGCNITAPFKNAAYRLAERCGEDAARAESANTLLFEPGGWIGESTDGGGLVSDLESLGTVFTGRAICLLGAGGAAAGVLAALLRQDPGALVIANRTVGRAQALADAHSDLGEVRACGLDELNSAGPFDLLINATSHGHGGNAPALDPGWFAPNGLCYDMNYGPASRPLGEACRKQGVRYWDGLGMLVGQAALSFRMWTGKRPDTAAVLDRLRHSAGK
jgi:shikimate dehydrogenase